MSRKPNRKQRSRPNRKTQKLGRRGRSPPIKPKLRVSVTLSLVLLTVFAFTITSLIKSVQDFGHVHVDIRLIVADAVLGCIVAAEWMMWIKYH